MDGWLLYATIDGGHGGHVVPLRLCPTEREAREESGRLAKNKNLDAEIRATALLLFGVQGQTVAGIGLQEFRGGVPVCPAWVAGWAARTSSAVTK